MKTQSAKGKGRRLQQWVVNQLVMILDLDPEDLESRPMGSQGEDIIIGAESRRKFPYSVECKNQERLNIWEAIRQAQTNAKQYEPLVVFKRNNTKPMVAVDAAHFIDLVRRANNAG